MLLVIIYLNDNSSWSAADFNFLSAVQSDIPISCVEANRCTSMKPIPFPIRWCLSIKKRISSNSIIGAIGRDCSKEIISFRFCRLPQANSPMINWWHITSASISSFSSCRSPERKWATQMEVSTRTMVVLGVFSSWNWTQFFFGSTESGQSPAAFTSN